MHKSRALLPIDSFDSRAAEVRGYRHRGQHSCPEHAHSASVDPRIISWVDRRPQRWQKEECSSFATARLHAEAATSATKKIVGALPFRCTSLGAWQGPCPSRPADCNPLVRDSRYLPCEEKFGHASEIFLPRGAFWQDRLMSRSGWIGRSRRRLRTIGQARRAGQMASAHVRT